MCLSFHLPNWQNSKSGLALQQWQFSNLTENDQLHTFFPGCDLPWSTHLVRPMHFLCFICCVLVLRTTTWNFTPLALWRCPLKVVKYQKVQIASKTGHFGLPHATEGLTKNGKFCQISKNHFQKYHFWASSSISVRNYIHSSKCGCLTSLPPYQLLLQKWFRHSSDLWLPWKPRSTEGGKRGSVWKGQNFV